MIMPLLLLSMAALGVLLAPEAFARVPDQDSRVRIQAPPRNEARHASLPYVDREAQAGLREFKGGRDVALITKYILVGVLLIVIIVLSIAL